MFTKITTFRLDSTHGIEFLDNELVKTASEVLLPEGHVYDPDFAYMNVRAVSAGEYWGCNKNADFFPEDELKKFYKTFLDAHFFKNHENKEVEKAIGDVLQGFWDDDMKYVTLLVRVDRKIAPTIARGFEKGFMTDVSMGCKIDHSICSICGNEAKTQSQYCEHIRQEKHKVYPDGRKVYEINIGPRFHDISAVLNGADRTAKMTGLFINNGKVAYYEGDDSMEKVASSMENLYKSESSEQMKNDSISLTFDSPFEKTASVKLNQGGLNLEKIAMLKKRIKGMILSSANSRAEADLKNKTEENIADKMLRTPSLSSDSVNRLGDGINRISDDNNVPNEQVFSRLMKLLALGGTRLTPPEFGGVMGRVIGRPVVGPPPPPFPVPVPEGPVMRQIIVRNITPGIEGNALPSPMNLPSILNTMRTVSSIPNIGNSYDDDSCCNEDRGKTIIIKIANEVDGVVRPDVDLNSIGKGVDNELIKLAMEVIPERSTALSYLYNDDRLEMTKIASENVERTLYNDYAEYCETEAGNLLEAMTKVAYAEYVGEIDDYFLSDEAECDAALYGKTLGIDKVAGLGSSIKATPIALGAYLASEYQGDKVRQGDDVGAVGRVMAENSIPIALAGQVAGTHYHNAKKYVGRHGRRIERNFRRGLSKGMVDAEQMQRHGNKMHQVDRAAQHAQQEVAQHVDKVKGTAETAKKGAGKIKRIAGKAYNWLKNASDNIDYYLGEDLLSKTAEYNEVDTLQDIDIFKDFIIDNKLAEEYTTDQIGMLKTATVMYGLNRQDMCDSVLLENGMNYSDINNFLQVCEDVLTEEVSNKYNMMR